LLQSRSGEFFDVGATFLQAVVSHSVVALDAVCEAGPRRFNLSALFLFWVPQIITLRAVVDLEAVRES